MLSSKQRAVLTSQSHELPTLVHIGKNGVNAAVLKEISEILDRRELVKVGVLKNSGVTGREIMDEVCAKLGAEPVHVIGSKIILYRYSTLEGVEHVRLS